MAVIGTASRGIVVYKLEGKPEMVKSVESPLKYQHRCVAIFRDKKKQSPVGKLCLKIETDIIQIELMCDFGCFRFWFGKC